MKAGQTQSMGQDQQTGRRKWFGHSKCNDKEAKKSSIFALLCGVHKKKEKKSKPKVTIEVVRSLDQGDAVHVDQTRDEAKEIEKRAIEKNPTISGEVGIIEDSRTDTNETIVAKGEQGDTDSGPSFGTGDQEMKSIVPRPKMDVAVVEVHTAPNAHPVPIEEEDASMNPEKAPSLSLGSVGPDVPSMRLVVTEWDSDECQPLALMTQVSNAKEADMDSMGSEVMLSCRGDLYDDMIESETTGCISKGSSNRGAWTAIAPATSSISCPSFDQADGEINTILLRECSEGNASLCSLEIQVGPSQQGMTSIVVGPGMDISVAEMHDTTILPSAQLVPMEEAKKMNLEEVPSLSLGSLGQDIPSMRLLGVEHNTDGCPSLALMTQSSSVKEADAKSMGSVTAAEILFSCNSEGNDDMIKSETAESFSKTSLQSRSVLAQVISTSSSSMPSTSTDDESESESESEDDDTTADSTSDVVKPVPMQEPSVDSVSVCGSSAEICF